MTRSSVGYSLGLTSKKANRNLSAFAAKFGIREVFAQQGKAQIKVRIFDPFVLRILRGLLSCPCRPCAPSAELKVGLQLIIPMH